MTATQTADRVTTERAAAILGVSMRWVQILINHGVLIADAEDNRFLVHLDSVEALRQRRLARKNVRFCRKRRTVDNTT